MTDKQLDSTDRAILQILKRKPTFKQADVARELGLSRNAISKRYSKPILAAAIEDLQTGIEESINEARRLAARRIQELVDSDNESIALKACQSLLEQDLKGAGSMDKPIRFVTIVNEVGVLESRQEVIEVDSED